MAKINTNYTKLPGNYLFADIANKVSAFTKANPDKEIIRLGIGDVTRALSPAVVKAMKEAADEMGTVEGLKGYGPYEGYDFLRELIVKFDYAKRGASIGADEIFVSEGAKNDTSCIGDIFGEDNIVAVCDPVYPVYVDSNVMGGRSGELLDNGKWSKIIYMDCTEENGFLPAIPSQKADLVYLCFPNNPTGATATKEYLEGWVTYALENKAVILYDSAYEAYIQEENIPHSIYEIKDAEKCAIEFRSFSKTAGFTGTRCAYAVVPKALVVDGESVNALWMRRQSTKFNGVSYIIQKGAAAVYSEEGQKSVRETIKYYMDNAAVIRDGLTSAGIKAYGGKNAPYIWAKAPNGLGSWEFFDMLLNELYIVTTPGVGFGPSGEGYIRLTAFGSAEKTREAVDRITKKFK